MAVYLDVDAGDTVKIGSGTQISVIRKSGSRARLRIESEYKVQLDRADEKPQQPNNPSAIRRPNPG